MPSHFVPPAAFILQNSRTLREAGKAARLPFPSPRSYPRFGFCPFSGPINWKGVLGTPLPLPVLTPSLAPGSPRPLPRFFLGKMEVVGAGGPGQQRFAARCRPAPLSCKIRDPPRTLPYAWPELRGTTVPPCDPGCVCPEFGDPERACRLLGLRAGSIAPAPAPSGFLRTGFLLPWPLALPSGPGSWPLGGRGPVRSWGWRDSAPFPLSRGAPLALA